MWKLKIAEGGSPWLRTTNNHVGRQFWEFNPKLGTPEELAAIEEARMSFTENRFLKKHSSDLLMRLQCLLRLKEPSVLLCCREEDLDMVEFMLDEASEEYSEKAKVHLV